MPEDDPDELTQPVESDDIRQLRKKAKRADDLERRLVESELKLAIRDAGLDLNQAQTDALVAITGDSRDPDALRAKATDLGWVAPPEPTVPAEEQEALDRVTTAAAGADVGAATDWDAELRSARNDAEFDAIYRRSGRPMK